MMGPDAAEILEQSANGHNKEAQADIAELLHKMGSGGAFFDPNNWEDEARGEEKGPFTDYMRVVLASLNPVLRSLEDRLVFARLATPQEKRLAQFYYEVTIFQLEAACSNWLTMMSDVHSQIALLDQVIPATEHKGRISTQELLEIVSGDDGEDAGISVQALMRLPLQHDQAKECAGTAGQPSRPGLRDAIYKAQLKGRWYDTWDLKRLWETKTDSRVVESDAVYLPSVGKKFVGFTSVTRQGEGVRNIQAILSHNQMEEPPASQSWISKIFRRPNSQGEGQ